MAAWPGPSPTEWTLSFPEHCTPPLRYISSGDVSRTQILVVDFEPSRLRTTKELLEGRGWSVITASSTAELNAATGGTPPPVVVLEPMLPGQDGFALCKELKRRKTGAPHVILAARIFRGQRYKSMAKEAGADIFLQRPEHDSLLLKVIEQLLGPNVPPGGAWELAPSGPLELEPPTPISRAAADDTPLGDIDWEHLDSQLDSAFDGLTHSASAPSPAKAQPTTPPRTASAPPMASPGFDKSTAELLASLDEMERAQKRAQPAPKLPVALPTDKPSPLTPELPSLLGATMSAPAPPPPPVATARPPAVSAPRSRRGLLIGLGVAAAVIALLYIVMNWLSGGSGASGVTTAKRPIASARPPGRPAPDEADPQAAPVAGGTLTEGNSLPTDAPRTERVDAPPTSDAATTSVASATPPPNQRFETNPRLSNPPQPLLRREPLVPPSPASLPGDDAAAQASAPAPARLELAPPRTTTTSDAASAPVSDPPATSEADRSANSEPQVVHESPPSTTSTSGSVDTPADGTEGATDAPMVPTVSSVTKPVVIPNSRIEPTYPQVAKAARRGGSVVLQVLVRADGTVGSVKIVQEPVGSLGLGKAAVSAVSKWRFWPGTQQGKPVDTYLSVVLNFTP